MIKFFHTVRNLKNYFKKRVFYFLNNIPSNIFFNTFLRKSKSNNGIIITLHRTLSVEEQGSAFNNFIEISASRLEEMIINLKKLQVKFVPLKELNYNLDKITRSPNPIAHISFDDGYYDNYTCAFKIFKKHNVCFSIFITSDYISNKLPFLWWYMLEYIIKNEIPVTFEKYNYSITKELYKANSKNKIFELSRDFMLNNIDNDNDYFEKKLLNYIPLSDSNIIPKMLGWKQINEMIDSGLCEIGIHTKSHPRFKNLTSEEKMMQIKHCKNEIFINTGIDSKYFAYPYGSKADIGSIDDLEQVMKNCGVNLAFTTVPGELNSKASKILMPRICLNDMATMYTLKTRLNGNYQRGINIK